MTGFSPSEQTLLNDLFARRATRLRRPPWMLVGDDATTPGDPTAANPPSARKPRFDDAAQTFGLLVERVGAHRAALAWGALPRDGQIAREDAAAAFRISAT